MLSPEPRKVTQDEHQRPATPPGHVERQRRGDDTPHLFALPEDLERRVGEHLGDWPYSPALATVARTRERRRARARAMQCMEAPGFVQLLRVHVRSRCEYVYMFN